MDSSTTIINVFELSCLLFWDGGMSDLTLYDNKSEDQIINKWNQNL